MNVADLLHLQTAFHADGIVQTSSDKKDIPGICILAGEPLDPLFVIQGFLDFLRQSSQFFNQLSVSFLADQTFYICHFNGKQIHCDQLCTVCFCRCHRNLRSCIGIENIIALAGNAGSHHIYHTQHRNAFLLRQTQSRQAVCRLTGLRYNNYKRILHKFRISVTELGSQIHFHRRIRQIFHYIFSVRLSHMRPQCPEPLSAVRGSL